MRVLFLSSPSPHSYKWVNALSERGHEIFFVKQKGETSLDKLHSKVRVIELPFKGKAGYYMNAFALRILYKKIKPDVVNVHYASGYGTLARMARIKNSLLSVWGSDVYDFPYKNKLCMSIIRKNLLFAKQIASTSNCMAQQVRSLIGDCRKITVTPFGVDINKFNANRFHHERSDCITIGCVKTLSSIYGIDDLIKSFSLVRNELLRDNSTYRIAENLRCMIYGDGEQRAELEALIHSLQLDGIVSLPGLISHESVPEVLSTFDIFCATSHRESFGVSLVEAQAMCLPVVATNTDGFKEVVDDGESGFIVKGRNIEDIAFYLIKLILDKSLRDKMGSNGRKRVLELYNFDDNVTTMELLFKSVKEGNKTK